MSHAFRIRRQVPCALTGLIVALVPILALCASVNDTACADVEALARSATSAARPFSIRTELEAATHSNDPVKAGIAKIHLAELAVADGRTEDALQTLDAIDSLVAKKPELAARIELGKANALAAAARFGNAKDHIRESLRAAGALPHDSPTRIDVLTHVARFLAEHPGVREAQDIKQAFALIAESLADATSPKLTISRLSSASANLYFASAEPAKSLDAAQHAAFLAQETGDSEQEYASDLLVGDAYVASGRTDDAIRAYQVAADKFPSARAELIGAAMLDPKGVRHFAGRAYLALADQLLSRAALNGPSAQDDRERAIAAMEAFKTAELQEFYLTACAPLSEPVAKSGFKIPAGWVVLYPIVFHDRVEVLSLYADSITQMTVRQVGELRAAVRQFRTALEQHSAERSGQLSAQLFEQLFRESLRGAREGDGIVYVPDSWLRTISLASLRSGSQYLIEQHPIVTAPSLQSAFASTAKASKNHTELIAGISDAVQGYPALPGVAREVQSIRDILTGTSVTSLQNEGFTRTAFTTSLSAGDFSLVHLATHGEFVGRADASFILTHDGVLHVDEFTSTLRGLSGDSLDLLVLSACQTATGDDRAALGLGGMAAQVGAKDVLATLWQVSDAASAKLIEAFYANAFKSGMSLPKALQQAQIALIHSQEFPAPDYWAPYLMIGGAQ